jgi:hypothetical protein
MGAAEWGDGEAVIRLAPDLGRSDDERNFFAPSDWRALDSGTQALILALGKDRNSYLLDRNDLGGIGGELAAETIARSCSWREYVVFRFRSQASSGARMWAPRGDSRGMLGRSKPKGGRDAGPLSERLRRGARVH